MSSRASDPVSQSEWEAGGHASAAERTAEHVRKALAHVSHLLPDQAPLSVFVHHNPLHALQHLHFHDAVMQARVLYGAEPYLAEARFRELLASGRISERDLDAALDDQFPGEDEALLGGLLSVRSVRRLLLLRGVRTESSASLRWLWSEGQLGDAQIDRSPSAALWKACLKAASGYASTRERSAQPVLLHRDIILAETGEDAFDLIFPALIRLASGYLDQGLAPWSMPHRELGFYRAVRALVADGTALPTRWMKELRADFRAQRERDLDAMAVVVQQLGALGVGPEEVEGYLEALLLTLPGWAGLISRLERHPEEQPDASPTSLLDFLAVRLTYERAALSELLRHHGAPHHAFSELCARRKHAAAPPARECLEQIAHRLYQLAQHAGIDAKVLSAQPRSAAHALLRVMDDFHSFAERRVFQEAYEHHHRAQILSALSAHRPYAELARSSRRPRFQLIACFDEREESFRRQLEEVEPTCETFGAPGFFGAAIRFHGLDASHHVALAPVVVNPTHLVEERPWEADFALHTARLKRRKRWAYVLHHLQRGSRSFARGLVLNAALGALALLPLLTRILSPRLAGRIRRFANERLFPSPRTELTVHHDAATDLPPGIVQRGFKLDERVVRVATVLENIGLTSNFAKLVVVLGHGATTLNNPHRSAYDCGACGGRQGGPNARVFCQMANDPAVRGRLAERGIAIPHDTWFVGGQHDTCSDAVLLYDLGQAPESHRTLLSTLRAQLEEARAHNAQERCRRLFSAPENASPSAALRHVEGRSEHLAEPRPEFGHATNAVAVVGRRGLTRGLFLDRRAFLISYDPTLDPDGTILERTLAAATPVGAGINLEYYFSHVDNERYGAGSKLPHNVAGYVGVMTGHASDLRTGLPRQMIEIHEPVRLLVIVEATPERLLEIAARQPEVRELVVHRWVQLVSSDPETGALQVFTDRGFVAFAPEATPLVEAPTSRDFYLSREGCLPPARIVGTAA